MNQNSKTLLIWDFVGMPPPGYHNIVLWQSYSCELYPNAISIPKIIEEHADDLKNKYLKLIYNLGKIKLNGRTLNLH